MAKKKDAAPAEAGVVAARVLVRFFDGEAWHDADSVIESAPDVVAQWKAAGTVDDHSDAVAYARSLRG